MEIITDRLSILTAVICAFVLGACSPTTTSVETADTITIPEKQEWIVEAETFYEAEEGAVLSGDDSAIEMAEGATTSASFEITVPTAGRYQIEVLASLASEEKAEFWIEDYIDNKDGRTYNITGTMALAADAIPTVDGSPLNAGEHKIKLHKSGGATVVDGIRFSLIREHQLTPDTLVQNMEGETWKLVWSDEFDTDGLPDQSKWTYDVGDWGWGNNELQYYTVEESKNARIEGGNLIIEAHKNDGGNSWTSARLTTRGKVSFVHGKIEFRAKVPVERGNWAAGWTLGDAYRDELSWPYCGEIDILETVGFELDDETGDGEAHASVHCGAYYFKLGNQPTATTPVTNMKEEFHTYGIEWDSERIMAYVDGEPYFEYSDNSSELAWPFDEPQNLILNLAMGGGWGGAQGMDKTVTNQQFIIDYVRVYGKE